MQFIALHALPLPRPMASLLSPRLFVCHRYVCSVTTASMNLKGGWESVDAKTLVSRQKHEETENNSTSNSSHEPPARGWGSERLGHEHAYVGICMGGPAHVGLWSGLLWPWPWAEILPPEHHLCLCLGCLGFFCMH